MVTPTRRAMEAIDAEACPCRPGYDRQRPEPFALALRAAKQALDPAGILNPGVLFDTAG
nr:FAD-linked oxidase C-terminal domain-containing protein [Streptomyces sp. SID14515]